MVSGEREVEMTALPIGNNPSIRKLKIAIQKLTDRRPDDLHFFVPQNFRASLNHLPNPLAATSGVSFGFLQTASGDVGSVRSTAQRNHQAAQASILKQGTANTKYSPSAQVNPFSSPGAKPVSAKRKGATLAKLDESTLTNRERYRVLNHLGTMATLLGKTEADLLRDEDPEELEWNLRAALREGFNEYKKSAATEAITRLKETIDFEKTLDEDDMSTASAMSDLSTASSVDSEASAASATEEARASEDQKKSTEDDVEAVNDDMMDEGEEEATVTAPQGQAITATNEIHVSDEPKMPAKEVIEVVVVEDKDDEEMGETQDFGRAEE